MRTNRDLYLDSIKTSRFAKSIDLNTLDPVTAQCKKYKVYCYEGKVVKSDNVIFLISYEVKEDGFEKLVCILCTDVELNTKTVLDYYSVRWTIETSYQYFKENFGFDQYHIRNRPSIERYFLFCFLAYNFLEVFRVSKGKLFFKTIGETIYYHKNVTAKKFVCFIYHRAK